MSSSNAKKSPAQLEAEREEEALNAGEQTQSLSPVQRVNGISNLAANHQQPALSAGLDLACLADPNLCIAELNKRYAVLNAGKKLLVIDEWGDPYPEIGVETFHGLFANVLIRVGKETIPVSRYWFKHPDRRTYEKGSVFAPEGNTQPGQYNTWKGFAVQPDPGRTCPLFLEHSFDVICSGDQEHYEYVLNWLALMVQQPGELPGVAICLLSEQGTGKGSWIKYIARMYGKHFMSVSNKRHLLGNFSDHLNEIVLLFADEMSWTDCEVDSGLLKVLITEETRTSEKKGGDTRTVKNFTHLITASNARWAVPAELSDRRFFILEVSDCRVKHFDYFDRLVYEMENGGPEALLAFLQARDISAFDPRDFPRTQARVNQQLASLEPINEWLYEFAELGLLTACPGQQVPADGWPDKVVKSEFYGAYCRWRKDHQKRGSPEGLAHFTSALRSFGFRAIKMPMKFDKNRPPAYSVPTLVGLRRAFDDALGYSVSWDPT